MCHYTQLGVLAIVKANIPIFLLLASIPLLPRASTFGWCILITGNDDLSLPVTMIRLVKRCACPYSNGLVLKTLL